MPAIAQGFTQLHDKSGLTHVLTYTQNLVLFDIEIAPILPVIAQGFAQFEDWPKLKKVLAISDALYYRSKIPVSPIISRYAGYFTEFSDSTQTLTLAQSVIASDTISDDTTSSLLTQLRDRTLAKLILRQYLEASRTLSEGEQVERLPRIARNFTHIRDTLGLADVLNRISFIGHSEEDKVKLLLPIAQGFTHLRYRQGLMYVLATSGALSEGSMAKVLPTVAQGFAQLDDWRWVNQIISDRITSNEAKAKALYVVLAIRYTRNNLERQRELLKIAEQ